MPAFPKLDRLLLIAAALLFAAGFVLAPAVARSGPAGLRPPAPAAPKLRAGSHPVAPPADRPAPRGFHPPAPYGPFYSYYAGYEPVGRPRLGRAAPPASGPAP